MNTLRGADRHYGVLEGFLAKERAKIANRLIPKKLRNGAILDVGSGTHPLFLMDTQFRAKYGIDRLTTERNRAFYIKNHNIELIKFNIAKGERFPFEDSTFDVVTMLAVFEHIKHKALLRLLREIHRVLKPGGRLLVTTPAAWADMLLRTLAKMRLVNPILVDEHQDAYTPAKIGSILERSYFTKENLRFGYFECFLNIWASAEKNRNEH